MTHLIIKNKQLSIIDLTPVKDTEGRNIVLRPAGSPGDSREIASDEVEHDIVVRVKAAGWVDVKPMNHPAPVVVEAPTKVVATVEVKPAPAPVKVEAPEVVVVAKAEEPVVVKAEEPAVVVKAEEPAVTPTPAPTPAPTPTPAPAKSRK